MTWAKITGITLSLLQTESPKHDAVLFHVKNQVRQAPAPVNITCDVLINKSSQEERHLLRRVKNIILRSTFPVQSCFTGNTLQ